jgi:tryptophan-rich sensory protein
MCDIHPEINPLLQCRTTSIFQSGDNIWYRVITVAIIAFLSNLLVKTGTRSNGLHAKRIRPSSFQPPMTLLSIINTLVFTFFLLAWVLTSKYTEPMYVYRNDILYLFNILLYLLWVVVFYSMGFVTPSSIIMTILLITSAFTAYITWIGKDGCRSVKAPAIPNLPRKIIILAMLANVLIFGFELVISITVKYKSVR